MTSSSATKPQKAGELQLIGLTIEEWDELVRIFRKDTYWSKLAREVLAIMGDR